MNSKLELSLQFIKRLKELELRIINIERKPNETVINNIIDSVKEAKVVDGNLILKMLNGAAYNAGNVMGAPGLGRDGDKGDKGEPGVGFNGIDGKDGLTPQLFRKDSHIFWKHENSEFINHLVSLDELRGAKGRDGKNGKDGVDGRGISSIDIQRNGDVFIELSDGEVITAGRVHITMGGGGLQYGSFSAIAPIHYNTGTGQFSLNPLTVSNFSSHNISQWTNDAGYLTEASLDLIGATNQINIGPGNKVSLTDGLSIGSYQTDAPPLGGLLMPGGLILGANTETNFSELVSINTQFSLGSAYNSFITCTGFLSDSTDLMRAILIEPVFTFYQASSTPIGIFFNPQLGDSGGSGTGGLHSYSSLVIGSGVYHVNPSASAINLIVNTPNTTSGIVTAAFLGDLVVGGSTAFTPPVGGVIISGNTSIGNSTNTYKFDVTGGDMGIMSAGNTIRIKQGSNACAGVGATMVAGAVTVATTAVATGDIVLVSKTTSGGTLGSEIPTVTISNNVSFTLTSSSALETSTFSWIIIKAA